MSAPAHQLTPEKLISGVKEVVASAEEFLHAAAGQSGEKLSAARAKVESALKAAREKVKDAEEAADAVATRAKEVVATTEQSIKDHPWTAISISAGIGLLIGILIGRR